MSTQQENIMKTMKIAGQLSSRAARRVKRLGAMPGARKGARRLMRVGIAVAGALSVAVLATALAPASPATTAHAAPLTQSASSFTPTDPRIKMQNSTSSSGTTYNACGYGGACPPGGWRWSQMCHSTDFFASNISQWTVPPGCFANIYTVNSNWYVYRYGYGWCNWWPEVLNPNRPNLLSLRRYATPRPGATVVFPAYDQGAGGSGHYGYVVAVSPGGYWILISEMNFYWRGGGWRHVNYRYVHLDGRISFIY